MEDLFNNNPLWSIIIRFVMNLFFLFILIRILYFRYTKKEKFMFTFFLIGITVFFICSMLKDIIIDVGIGLGLFAIFSILRFRTRNFSIKDMAYILTIIAMSTINSFKLVGFPMLGVLIFNIIIIISTFILEEYLVRNKVNKHSIIYENLELLKPENNRKLL